MSQPLTLYIGNKNYSSWSMRIGVLLKEKDIEFREIKVRFDSFSPQSEFKKTILAINPTGTVPVLVDNNLVIWDSLAIAEYLAEKFLERQLWPDGVAQRARARSLCAAMHGGFTALRNACPMNIEAKLPEVGALAWRDNAALRADVARLETLLGESLQRNSGPFLFGEQFSIADAFYAPVVMRLQTYALPVSATLLAYMKHITNLPSVQGWIVDALQEHDFRAFEEPYRLEHTVNP
ncbi:glutathione S-transferase family protein [Lampropedia puyangensis]|uniref:Glutathione S-transferase family protein n=1 Tax=Lampropedia puyangensis TaxID=1330072 RepID=A0A4S8FC23_9BURK|nr:glutathione S-transferase family protein [Lampropedia puyangensis]THU05183.1 glutathione S-transferase family protein [Lampropedia puyangensis]